MLFRSVDLKLPPPQLGWDVGTFEFLSDKISSTFAPGSGNSKVKLKLRTGGSSAVVKKEQCNREGDGMEWDISGITNNEKPRLPVRYRYRSPVFFEFHTGGHRSAQHFAAIWLQELADMEDKDFDIPIWKCDNSMRLSQNFITPANVGAIPDIAIEEVGRLRFTGRFKPGTDRDHFRFVSDNDSRETIETWEACFAEGVRQEEVVKEVPPAVQKMHEDSLTHGRDVLAMASDEDKRRWLSKDGTDWSGAFGMDPAELMTSRKSRVGFNPEDEYEPSDDDDESDGDTAGGGSSSALSSPRASKKQSTDLGISDATTDPSDGSSSRDHNNNNNDDGNDGEDGYVLSGAPTNGSAYTGKSSTSPTSPSSSASVMSGGSGGSGSSKNPLKALKDYRSRSRDLHRQQRGLMQWRPMRNAQFAKDEAKYAVRRVTKMGSLSGRQPDVETEIS